MNHIRVTCVAVLLISGAFSACRMSPDPNAEKAERKQAIQSLIESYVEQFNERKLETMPTFWHPPGWVAFGDGSRMLERDEDVRDFYQETMEAIKVQGFDHSKVIDTKITMLNPTCALVDMTFNRWNKKGEIIPPSGRSVTYLLLERSGRWGISTLIVPGTDQVIPRSATG